jgi:hypothetical protein
MELQKISVFNSKEYTINKSNKNKREIKFPGYKSVVILLMLFVSTALQAKDTELKLYRPFESVSQSILDGQHALTGVCSQQSQRIKREDAWRCLAEGKVYDPCFIKQYGSHQQALCPQSPWSQEGVLLTLSSPVDNSQHAKLDMSRTYPWGIELVDGEKCLALDEGSYTEGLPIHYQCTNLTQLIGHLQRCKVEWTMLHKAMEGQVDTVVIAKAWF